MSPRLLCMKNNADKSLFRKMALPTDSYECHSWNEVTKGNDMTRLWDGITDTDPCFQTKTTTVMPQWFTFDMGEKYKLSRFVMVSRYYPGKYGNTFKAGHRSILNCGVVMNQIQMVALMILGYYFLNMSR